MACLELLDCGLRLRTVVTRHESRRIQRGRCREECLQGCHVGILSARIELLCEEGRARCGRKRKSNAKPMTDAPSSVAAMLVLRRNIVMIVVI